MDLDVVQVAYLPAMNPTPGQQTCFRTPQRISITLAQHVVDALVIRSQQEGRSVSDLSAYLLESSLQQQDQRHLYR